MKVEIEGKIVECIKGDITKQVGFDAVVNAANRNLAPGGGVAGAIHKAAGSHLYEECRKLAPIKTGEAVITAGFNLPNRYVIHTLGPVYTQEENPQEKLKQCYRNCLKIAEQNKLESVAFCAISCGIFGYPLEEGLMIAFCTFLEEISHLKSLKRIRMVLYNEEALRVGESVFKEVFKEYL